MIHIDMKEEYKGTLAYEQDFKGKYTSTWMLYVNTRFKYLNTL